MRDMVAQCDSNMSELQQLQVRPPPSARAPPTASDGGGVSADEPRAEWVVQTRHARMRDGQSTPPSSPTPIEWACGRHRSEALKRCQSGKGGGPGARSQSSLCFGKECPNYPNTGIRQGKTSDQYLMNTHAQILSTLANQIQHCMSVICHDPVGLTPGWFNIWKLVNITYDINRLKKTLTIIPVDAEKASI